MSRSSATVAKAFSSSSASYCLNRAGMRAATHSRATTRANPNPIRLAIIVPTMLSPKATGQGQMSGAATTNTVPGTPNGCSRP